MVSLKTQESRRNPTWPCRAAVLSLSCRTGNKTWIREPSPRMTERGSGCVAVGCPVFTIPLIKLRIQQRPADAVGVICEGFF